MSRDEGQIVLVPGEPLRHAGVLEDVSWVLAEQQRLEEQPVPQPVDAAGRVPVGGRVGGSAERREVERDAVRPFGRPDRVEGQAVPEQEMVYGLERVDALVPAGSEVAAAVAVER